MEQHDGKDNPGWVASYQLGGCGQFTLQTETNASGDIGAGVQTARNVHSDAGIDTFHAVLYGTRFGDNLTPVTDTCASSAATISGTESTVYVLLNNQTTCAITLGGGTATITHFFIFLIQGSSPSSSISYVSGKIIGGPTSGGTANQVTYMQCTMEAVTGGIMYCTSTGWSAPFGIGSSIVGSSNVTAQSTSQSTVTLATSPTAGSYRLNYYSDMSTPCTTGSNSVSFAFNWTDGTNARLLATGSLSMPNAQSTSSYLSGVIPLQVGSGNVTYTSTVTGTCATGTSAYDIHATLERVQ